jgi:hypothetical protein
MSTGIFKILMLYTTVILFYLLLLSLLVTFIYKLVTKKSTLRFLKYFLYTAIAFILISLIISFIFPKRISGVVTEVKTDSTK